jgi:hypothetical protein
MNNEKWNGNIHKSLKGWRTRSERQNHVRTQSGRPSDARTRSGRPNDVQEASGGIDDMTGICACTDAAIFVNYFSIVNQLCSLNGVQTDNINDARAVAKSLQLLERT